MWNCPGYLDSPAPPPPLWPLSGAVVNDSNSTISNVLGLYLLFEIHYNLHYLLVRPPGYEIVCFPFKPSRCIKESFYISENIPIMSLQLGVLERKGFRTKMILVYQYTWRFFLILKPHQIIFIHYKSRIATAIRGLLWMKMTMVNSGLKGLKWLWIHPFISKGTISILTV